MAVKEGNVGGGVIIIRGVIIRCGDNSDIIYTNSAYLIMS
jgi:hypothetical protein